ncbi:MAG: hypothetical protein ACUVXI_13410 [bacterium]
MPFGGRRYRKRGCERGANRTSSPANHRMRSADPHVRASGSYSGRPSLAELIEVIGGVIALGVEFVDALRSWRRERQIKLLKSDDKSEVIDIEGKVVDSKDEGVCANYGK